ncbi:MAG: hypothetical protein K0S76_2260 [Herbinix sp.]|jgi:uncharacterized protein GlcG (DUF336 family)|nr:hypothetical protein [Herbinix sp.]
MKEEDISKIVISVVRELKNKQKMSSSIDEHPVCLGKAPKMSLQLALSLIDKIKLKAVDQNLRVVIAVVDSGARPVAVECMDEAYLASYDIALNKAFTSVSLQMSTEELGKLSQPGNPLYGIQYTNHGQIVIFGGGEPLVMNGILIGGVGISGGTAKEDTDLAAYAKQVCKEVSECL